MGCLTIQPLTRNSSRVKYERIVYMQRFFSDFINEKCIFIDEAGVNLWTSRSFGRSKKGLIKEGPAVRQLNYQRGKNLNLIMAISPSCGLLHYKFILGNVNRTMYQEFLNAASSKATEVFHNSQCFLIMDNAPIHSNVGLECAHHQCIRLPPYSPFLNLVRMLFPPGKLK